MGSSSEMRGMDRSMDFSRMGGGTDRGMGMGASMAKMGGMGEQSNYTGRSMDFSRMGGGTDRGMGMGASMAKMGGMGERSNYTGRSMGGETEDIGYNMDMGN